MNGTVFDFSALILMLLACATGIAAWLYRASQATTPRTLKVFLILLLRLAVVYAFAFAVLCGLLSMPALIFVILVGIVLLLSYFATYDNVDDGHVMPVGNDAFGFALVYTIMIPIYILKQFILGFPDREILVLRPDPRGTSRFESSGSAQVDSVVLYSRGSVRAALKPCGTVQVAETVYPAVAADGRYIDESEQIVVIGCHNGQLVVRLEKTFETQ